MSLNVDFMASEKSFCIFLKNYKSIKANDPCERGFYLEPESNQFKVANHMVHGFPEPVKSFITFVILSKISCGKVQKKTRIFLHKTVS